MLTNLLLSQTELLNSLSHYENSNIWKYKPANSERRHQRLQSWIQELLLKCYQRSVSLRKLSIFFLFSIDPGFIYYVTVTNDDNRFHEIWHSHNQKCYSAMS